MSYFRSDIEAMTGYTPGEQPKGRQLIKLNTNENPFPPSQAVVDAIRNFPFEELRKYPTPYADPILAAVEKVYQIPPTQVIAGNGSDEHPTQALADMYALFKWRPDLVTDEADKAPESE